MPSYIQGLNKAMVGENILQGSRIRGLVRRARKEIGLGAACLRAPLGNSHVCGSEPVLSRDRKGAVLSFLHAPRERNFALESLLELAIALSPEAACPATSKV